MVQEHLPQRTQGTVIYLATDPSSYVTGTTIPVEGLAAGPKLEQIATGEPAKVVKMR